MPTDVLTPEQVAEAHKQEIDKLKVDFDAKLNGVVDELKTLRSKNGELSEKNKELEVKLNPPRVDDTEQKIQVALSRQKTEEAQRNAAAALKAFQLQNKEFHPDSDPGGLKLSMLQNELKNFNTSGLYSVDEHLSVLEKAQKLLSRDTFTNNPPARLTENVGHGGTPKVIKASELTPHESQLIKDLGWTEERYIKLKASQPSFVNELLR